MHSLIELAEMRRQEYLARPPAIGLRVRLRRYRRLPSSGRRSPRAHRSPSLPPVVRWFASPLSRTVGVAQGGNVLGSRPL
jgi:hypothetical protein